MIFIVSCAMPAYTASYLWLTVLFIVLLSVIPFRYRFFSQRASNSCFKVINLQVSVLFLLSPNIISNSVFTLCGVTCSGFLACIE